MRCARIARAYLLSFAAAVATFAALPGPPAQAADVQVSQFDDVPDPAVRGGTYVYNISVENNAADPAANVVLTLPLPATTTFVSVTPGAQCGFDGGTPGNVVCNFGTVTGSLVGGPTLAVAVTLRTTAGSPVTVTTTATVTTTSTDTNPANNALSQTTTIDNGADLGIVSLSGSPTTVSAGGNVVWTASVRNQGPDDAANVVVTNTLPTSMTYVSATGTGWSCSAAGQVVTCSRAALASGATAPDINVTGTVTGAITGTITDVASVSSDTGEPNSADNTATANVTVNPGTDLAITQNATAPNPGISGQNVTFTLLPRNNGPFAATTVTVTDTLPAGFTYVSGTGTGWTCGAAGQTVTCSAASYAVGAANNISIVATAPTVATSTGYTNTAVIAAASPNEANTGNNTSNLAVTVVPDGVDLALTKIKTPNPVAQGSNMTSTLGVHNNGPQGAATGTITVTDTLPAGESYFSYSGASWNCGAGGQVVTCTYNAALAASANTSNLVLTTTAVNAGVLTNNAAVGYSGVPGDWNAANNAASASVTSTVSSSSIDLDMSKSVTTANGDGTLSTTESTITYTLTVSNAGPGDATGVVVTDAIPGYTTAAGGTGITASRTGGVSTATFSCSTGSTVTCTQTGGTIAAGTNAIFTIAVSRPIVDGSFTNTASVTSTDQGDTDLSNNSGSVAVTVAPIADVQMQTKTVTPASVKAGTNATYLLTFINNGPSTAANVVVTDVFTLPGGDANFTVISTTPSKGTCTYNAGTSTLNCPIGSMNSGETQTVTMVVRPNWEASPPAPRTYTNVASITTTTAESTGGGDNGNNSQNGTLDIQPASVDVLINNTDTAPAGPDPLGYDPAVPANNVIYYQVTTTNRGPSLASGVQFTYTMTPPAGRTITFLGDKASLAAGFTSVCDNVGSSVTGPATLTLTCVLPATLAVNASVDRYLAWQVQTAPPTTSDTYTTVATVTTNETESNLANNVEGETTTVRVRSDLNLTKTPSLATAQLRQPFNWTLTVTNTGPGDSTVTTLTDTLPAEMGFSGAAPSWTNNDGGSGTCSIAGQVLTCDLTVLNAGKVATVIVPVRMNAYPAGGTSQNCASVTTNQVDPNAGNNTSVCSSVTVQKSSLAGNVYRDLNGNGILEGGEPGLPGTTITLTGTDAYGNAVNLTTATIADGSYLFDNLSPAGAAGYTVTETQPAAWSDGLDAVGSAGGTLGNDVLSAIHLDGNTAATGYNFGEGGVSVSGRVYYDANGNGSYTPGEQGIQGVTVVLTGTDSNGNAVNRTTTTAADGTYSFGGLPTANGAGYTITETQPAGYNQGTNTVGSLGSAIAGDTITGIHVAAVDGVNYNFGEVVAIPASVSGRVWLDSNHDRVDDDGTGSGQAGWTVEIIKRASPTSNTYTLIATTTTDAAGNYGFTNLLPNNVGDATDRYEIRFRHPQNGAVYGEPVSVQPGVDLTYGTIRNLQLNPGDNVLNQSLPLDPEGVVYDAVTRAPVPGATVTLNGPPGFDAATQLLGGAANQTQVTGPDGLYQYLLLPGAPSGVYTIAVTAPTGYVNAVSGIIPVCTGTLVVGAVPNPALVQAQDTAPAAGTPAHNPAACGLVPGGSVNTQYFLSFNLTVGVSANMVNNHIPLDPILGGAIIVSKSTPLVNVSRGDLVPYTVTATNTLSSQLANIAVYDRIPPGFRYRTGSGSLNGVAREPLVAGRDLAWGGLTFAAGERKIFRLVLAVGSGVSEGEYVNEAWAVNTLAGSTVSNIATATVRIVPDPTFDCSDLIGKVFDDKNANGYQDEGEPGIPNVRVVTPRGLLITTDAEGRFHIACADVPNEDHGSNFVMKLDERTLPSGYRLTTENPRDVRLTRGKMAKLNFGATVHRVVRLDLGAAAFGSDDALLPEWRERLAPLAAQLEGRPSVLRIAYSAAGADSRTAQRRMDDVAARMRALWKEREKDADGKTRPRVPLVIETEVAP